MRIRRNSRPFRIMQALSQAPHQWFSATSVLTRVAALDVGAEIARGGLWAVLGELERAGFVETRDEVTRTLGAKPRKRYRITVAGRKTLEDTAPDAFPWTPGQIVEAEHATYRIRERFPWSGRGLMFVAEVVTPRNSAKPMPTWFAPGALVMIKATRPLDTAVGDSARYLLVVNETLDLELPTLKRLIDVPRVVDTVDWGALTVLVGRGRSQRPLRIRYIVQRRLAAGQHLSAYVQDHKLTTATQWWTCARALAEGVRNVHAIGTLHRDIRPENIVIEPSGDETMSTPVFVDVGEAIFRKVGPPAGGDAVWSRELFTAPEQRGTRIQPSRRADLYSLGAVLYFMVKGEPPDFPLADEDALKEAVARSLRFEGSVVRQDYAIADVISRCLCLDPERRMRSAEELLDELRVRPSSLDADGFVQLDRTRELVTRLRAQGDSVFTGLAAVEFSRLNEHLESVIANGVVVIEGSRDRIVRQLSTYISTLQRGSEYIVKTVPRFWWPANLGIRSRYMSENIELVRRGARVRRLLVLTEDDRADPLVHDIVRAHLDMEDDCASLGDTAGSVETRYKLVPAEDRRRMIQTGDQRGIWVDERSAVSLIPTYDSKGVIRSVTLRRSDGDERKALLADFDEEFRSRDCHPLREWATG